MSMTGEDLRDICQVLIMELTRLQQLNRPLLIDEFYKWTDEEKFISNLFEKYGNYVISAQQLKAESKYFSPELLSYLENALSRHANVVYPETYGVVDDAYLLAINVIVAISREADDMR